MSEIAYTILKIIRCEISDSWCEGDGSYHEIQKSVIPKCENCYIYNDWKKSGLSFEEYREQEGNALNGSSHESDSDVTIWR